MLLFLLSIILGFALRRTWTAILRQRRSIARLKHMQAEIAFMKPLLDKLAIEALARWAAGDWEGYEKTRQRYNQLHFRWKREITDKLNTP